MLRGVIFDLDGTLVDSQLDFDLMRAEMNLPPGTPILEGLETLSPERQRHCQAILARHEIQGAEQATLFPGVRECLDELLHRGLRLAILTRNRRQMAQTVLERLAIAAAFDPVISREDGPVKPDPWAIRHICGLWQVETHQVAMIGDFHFDITAGRRAGSKTVLVACGRDPAGLLGADEADLVLDSFAAADRLLAWLENGAKH